MKDSEEQIRELSAEEKKKYDRNSESYSISYKYEPMKEKAVKINVKTNKNTVSKEPEEGPVIEVASTQVADTNDANNETADNGRVEESIQGFEINEASVVEMVVEKAKEPETPHIEIVGRVETEEGYDSRDASPLKVEIEVDVHDGHKAKVSINVVDEGEDMVVDLNEEREVKNVTKGLEELDLKHKDE